MYFKTMCFKAFYGIEDLKTNKIASILNKIKTNKVKKKNLLNKTRQYNALKGPKTSKIASILNKIKTNKV